MLEEHSGGLDATCTEKVPNAILHVLVSQSSGYRFLGPFTYALSESPVAKCNRPVPVRDCGLWTTSSCRDPLVNVFSIVHRQFLEAS